MIERVHIEVGQSAPECLWTIREHHNDACLSPDNWLQCVDGHHDWRRCVQRGPTEHNKVMKSYRDAIYARILGNPNPPNMQFKLMSIGKGALNPATINDTQLEQEIFRKPFLEIFETSDGWIQSSYPIGTVSAGASTTIQGVPAPTSTTFTVLSTSGMNIGGYVQVQCPTVNRIRQIINIVGSAITVADLGEIPAVGATVTSLTGDVTANSFTSLITGLPLTPNPTSTVLYLDALTGIQVGTRVRIATATSYKFRTVLGVAGNSITITDLGEVPPVGNTVDTVWGEMALWMDSASPFILNSGTMVNRVVLATGYYKNTNVSVSVEAKFRENLGT